MDGIEKIHEEGCNIFHILNFSNELKEAIRKWLPFICYGESSADTCRRMYNYNSTLKEFKIRYDKKTLKQKKGSIGELLIHVLIHVFLNDFIFASAFFNISERSAKKGFDIILQNTNSDELYITEVKSGNLLQNKTSTQTINYLINNAKKDLKERLNNPDNFSLWLNAISGAKSAIKDTSDKKAAIISILEDYGDGVSDESLTSSDINVILGAVLFENAQNLFDSNSVQEKRAQINAENIFKLCNVIAIQKNTYEAIYDFIESEIENE